MNHRSVTLGLIVLTAVYAAVILNVEHETDSIRTVLQSNSELEVSEGIEQSKQLHYDECKVLLTPLINQDSKHTALCEDVLIEVASRDGRILDLHSGGLTTTTNDALQWWVANPPRLQSFSEPIPEDASPWLTRLWSLQQHEIDDETLLSLNSMPFHDRDGSVLLAVLALNKHTPLQERSATTTSLLNSIDRDELLAGLLLSAIWNEKIEAKRFSNDDELSTVASILQSKDTALAWRTLHNDDGTIRPDQMLAGLLMNQDEFVPLLIESAIAEKWQHPDHAIELGKWIRPAITERLPTQGLTTVKSTLDWWRKFKCGYLIEQGIRND